MVTESQIYRDLQIHLDKLPIGFPPTESGVEIRILKHLFTPEEAKLARASFHDTRNTAAYLSTREEQRVVNRRTRAIIEPNGKKRLHFSA